MARVLFIEDDPSWQNLLKKLLETAGHRTERATSCDIALAILNAKDKMDLIVFDLRLDASSGSDPFVWLDALIQGLTKRRMNIPPVIVVTGIPISKRDIVRAFTEYRGRVVGFFEKADFEVMPFMRAVKEALGSNGANASAYSFSRLGAYAALLTCVVLAIFAVLLWSVRQIADPKSQQTILQVGGAIVIILAVMLSVFGRHSKIEDVIDSITKIWRP